MFWGSPVPLLPNTVWMGCVNIHPPHHQTHHHIAVLGGGKKKTTADGDPPRTLSICLSWCSDDDAVEDPTTTLPSNKRQKATILEPPTKDCQLTCQWCRRTTRDLNIFSKPCIQMEFPGHPYDFNKLMLPFKMTHKSDVFQESRVFQSESCFKMLCGPVCRPWSPPDCDQDTTPSGVSVHTLAESFQWPSHLVSTCVTLHGPECEDRLARNLDGATWFSQYSALILKCQVLCVLSYGCTSLQVAMSTHSH